jgi:hypothetical protein
MLEIKDAVDVKETDTADKTEPTAKTFECKAVTHEGDRNVKLGFNFRESRSKKDGDGYTDYQFWYRNLCKPCGQQILLEAQK